MFVFYLFLAPYARTTRYEEVFFSSENFSLGKPSEKRLASLARLIMIRVRERIQYKCTSASTLAAVHVRLYDGNLEHIPRIWYEYEYHVSAASTKICRNDLNHDEMSLLCHTEDSSVRVWGNVDH